MPGEGLEVFGGSPACGSPLLTPSGASWAGASPCATRDGEAALGRLAAGGARVTRGSRRRARCTARRGYDRCGRGDARTLPAVDGTSGLGHGRFYRRNPTRVSDDARRATLRTGGPEVAPPDHLITIPSPPPPPRATTTTAASNRREPAPRRSIIEGVGDNFFTAEENAAPPVRSVAAPVVEDMTRANPDEISRLRERCAEAESAARQAALELEKRCAAHASQIAALTNERDTPTDSAAAALSSSGLGLTAARCGAAETAPTGADPLRVKEPSPAAVEAKRRAEDEAAAAVVGRAEAGRRKPRPPAAAARSSLQEWNAAWRRGRRRRGRGRE